MEKVGKILYVLYNDRNEILWISQQMIYGIDMYTLIEY